ncbi:MAG: amino acid adenylation domain-containing protein, partial [bacterium]|nr:amino acid adenylation domain-containing protein [bacterium]
MNIVDSLHAHKLLKLPVAADLAGPDAAAGPQGSPEVPPPEPLARRDDAPGNAPLSFAQQRVWLLDRFEPGSALHNLPAVLRLTGRLNPEALTRALNEIVRRHEVLRTSFQAVGDEPVQVIRPVLDLRLPVVDLNRLGDPERRPEARRLALAEARQPFDPAEAPLLRTRLLRLSSGTPDREQHALLVTAHDIVFDGWSAGVVLDELAALYRAFSAGHSSPLPELPVQYADFAVWQRQRLAKGSPGKLLENQLAYWHKRLTGLPVLELPTDRPRPALQSFRGTTEPFSLPAELGRRLEELAREQGTTLSTTLLAAFQALVGRTSGQQDLAVGAVVAHRDRPELEAMVGPFANTLVLRGDLRGDPSFAELLARVRDVVVGACAHRELPFELLVEELEPERNLSRNPLVQVLFVIQNDVPEPARELAPGLGVELGSVPTGAVMYDLTLALSRAKAGLSGFLEYNTGLFDASTLRRMAGHFHALLAGLTADPEQRLSQLSQLSPAEQQQLLVEWNDTRSESPRKAPIPRLFEVQVERTPDAVAVMLGNEFAAAEARPAEYLSYRELNRQANRLSHHLQALAVGPEVPVGIYLERSPGMVTAILAVLKAGGLYVPLDPTYPRERLRFMIEDSGIPVVLTREDLAGQLPSCSARPFYLGQTGPGAEENPTSGATADNLAYLLYTSGSTGRPKGVACNHVGATDLLADFAARAPIAAGDRCSWWTSLNFDVSVYEIFSALLAGGSLCIVPEDVRADGEGFVGWLRGERITSAYVSPSMLPELAKQVQREQEQEQLALRRLLVGVEPIAETLLATIREGIAGLRIINGYGPTEATICASLYNLRASADGAREPRNTPIGRPSRNTEIYLLDRHLRPTPPGVPGELEIGGDGLARGYHRRPQLTAERFIPNPFSAAPGALLYRTGDLARTLPSGDLMFLGRRDFQVKVRGFRIELGEIEAAVGRHPAVREAVVVAAGPESAAAAEERRLVAYVVREGAEELDAGELRAFLRESLPSYMVPSALVLLEALPRTPNGKVDRRALPAPEPAAAAELAESRAAPRGPVEEILAGIWAEVLEMTGPASRRVGIHDDFFELGGHSLRATQVASRANTALGVGIGPQLLFEHPTVAELAAVVERLAAADWEAPIEARGPEARRAPLPLSFAQERLWFLHQLQPEDTAYNIAFALHFAGALDPETLRRTFQEILRRHEILRTTYAIVDEEPRQLISPPGEHPLPLVDLHALAPGPRQEQLEQLMRHDEGRPFDQVRGPIFRTTLLRLVRPPEHADAADRAEHVLLFCCHHIAFDGWSMGVIARELAVLYRAFAAGAEAGTDSSPLAPLPIQYADFARWQRRW